MVSERVCVPPHPSSVVKSDARRDKTAGYTYYLAPKNTAEVRSHNRFHNHQSNVILMVR